MLMERKADDWGSADRGYTCEFRSLRDSPTGDEGAMIPFNRLRIWLRITLGLAFGAWLSTTAMAADVPLPTKTLATPVTVLSPWTFSVTPYAWAISLNGSATVRGRTTNVDAGFIDLLDHTKIPMDFWQLAAQFEARNDRLSIFADLIYTNIGLGASLTRTRSVDDLNFTVGASAGLKVQMVIAELAAAYEVAHWGPSNAPGSGTAIDLYGGVRGWWQRADANLALSGTANIGDLTLNADRTLTASGSVSWADPLIGARLRHQFAPAMNLVLRGDIGGFGVGSNFSRQALAALNYDFCVRNNVTWSGMIGYRALYVDYSRGAGLTHYEYNMTKYGPMFGISARF